MYIVHVHLSRMGGEPQRSPLTSFPFLLHPIHLKALRSPVISSSSSTTQHAVPCTVNELLMCAAADARLPRSPAHDTSICIVDQMSIISELWRWPTLCGMRRVATRQLSGHPKRHQTAITRTLPSPQQTQNTEMLRCTQQHQQRR
jgi:hypothetical protein